MKIIVNNNIVNNLKNWFSDYVNEFKYDDKGSQRNIDIKREHAERVTQEIINIGKQIGLNENELNLASIIALFHDIGRFEQYKIYGTFSDQRTEDHADLGIKVLKNHNVIGVLDKDTQKLILCSIKYHNKPSIPSDETKICIFYSRLIRDADKLDIWRVVTDYYHRKNGERNVALELELPDTPGISKKVYNALKNKQIVDMNNVRNINDIKLLQAGWVFDINFKPTFRYINERKYIKLIRDSLPESDMIDHIFNIINRHVNQSLI